MNEVTIFLTTPDALLFKEFQQFHKTFALLCSKGVFDTKNGSITLHFGPSGEISSIVRQDSLYNAKVAGLQNK